jgi:hypothetical protein
LDNVNASRFAIVKISKDELTQEDNRLSGSGQIDDQQKIPSTIISGVARKLAWGVKLGNFG